VISGSKGGSSSKHSKQKQTGAHRKDGDVRKKRDYWDKGQSADKNGRGDADYRRRGLDKEVDYAGSENDGVESMVESSSLDENQVRIFVAIYDYNPSTMSPNPDAAIEELPFTEGQLLKVCDYLFVYVIEIHIWSRIKQQLSMKLVFLVYYYYILHVIILFQWGFHPKKGNIEAGPIHTAVNAWGEKIQAQSKGNGNAQTTH